MEFSLLSNLRWADFIGNPIQGMIPTELGLVWMNLEQMAFAAKYPKLSGPVPSEIGLLLHLDIVLFVNTSISGMIPTDVGRLSNLLFLLFTPCNCQGPASTPK
jgi:hypothetical protein